MPASASCHTVTVNKLEVAVDEFNFQGHDHGKRSLKDTLRYLLPKRSCPQKKANLERQECRWNAREESAQRGWSVWKQPGVRLVLEGARTPPQAELGT